VSPQAAFIIGNILSDAQARASTFGLDSVLGTRFWSAVKTGTSKDMRDNWAIGWSQHYTVGVWVGNASGAAMHNVSGSSGAAPIWADIMAGLHASTKNRPPEATPGLIKRNVQFAGSATSLDPAREEWFVTGTEQDQFDLPAAPHSLGASTTLARIEQPTDGTILALDPDIPPQRQQLRLQSNRSDVVWWVGGQKVGQGRLAHWLPVPGRHVVQIQNAQGRVTDEITLEVRGAAIKPP